MESLTQFEVVCLLLWLGILVAVARVMGEIAERFSQPAVLGELIAGIILGPTVFGMLAPDFASKVLPNHGHLAVAFSGLSTLAIVMFLFVAGMEVDLSIVWRQGRTALLVGALGLVAPFAVGFAVAWSFPEFMGSTGQHSATIFALFMATALSISALPVIARTLIDLNMYRSDFGMLIIGSAMLDDIVGWLIFAVILALMGVASTHGPGIAVTIGSTLLFAVGMLTVGRVAIHRALPWVQAHTRGLGGGMSFALALALVGAAFTEWLGIHAIFGSFLVGVALGDSSHLREQTRVTINRFVSFFFAPLFFASVGLRVNFIENFDLGLVLVLFVVAAVGKVFGCTLGARWGGMPSREAWAVGFAMNSRGTMQIPLGLLALQYGLITERMFVAILVIAISTSMMCGPLVTRLLRRKKPRRLSDYFSSRAFVPGLKADTRQAVIAELVATLGDIPGYSRQEVVDLVWERETTLPTGLENGLAVPHARLDRLSAPLLAVGISPIGVDFDAPDGAPARILFLLLTPRKDDGLQLELLADIGRTFSDPSVRSRAVAVKRPLEFMALLKERRD